MHIAESTKQRSLAQSRRVAKMRYWHTRGTHDRLYEQPSMFLEELNRRAQSV
jgi:hypothetical protein